MAVCRKCDAFFVGIDCASCGWKVSYRCWGCKSKIDPALATQCACRWFKCPKCEKCGCNGGRPPTREQRIIKAIKNSKPKCPLLKSRPEDYPFLDKPSPTTDSVVDAYCEWPAIKEFPWEYFVTFTFPWKVSKEEAEKLWRVYTSRLAKRVGLPCRFARKAGIPWVGSIEFHKNGNPHVHGLLAHVSNINPKLLKWMWGELAGRFDTQVHVAKVVMPANNVLRYVVKTADEPDSVICVSSFFKQ